MKRFILQFFTWWNGATLNTRFHTWRRGRLVGTDGEGNRYYEDRHNGRRWVLYAGLAEASRVPPGWHGWLHKRVATPPTAEDYLPFPWEKQHVPNLTGTAFAYRPPGSILGPGKRPEVTGDYEPWRP